MTDSEKVAWKRLSVEMAAIVGSILLAFSIEAWWEERQNRVEEASALERLRIEFELIVTRIDDHYVHRTR